MIMWLKNLLNFLLFDIIIFLVACPLFGNRLSLLNANNNINDAEELQQQKEEMTCTKNVMKRFQAQEDLQGKKELK
jgi:hypothetical protein